MLWHVDFACNDGGRFAGRVWAASIYGNYLELDTWGRGVKFTEVGRDIRIHRRTFRTVGSTFGGGYWCWNRYYFRRQEYRRLVRTMAANGWRCTDGLVRWSDAYDALCKPGAV